MIRFICDWWLLIECVCLCLWLNVFDYACWFECIGWWILFTIVLAPPPWRMTCWSEILSWKLCFWLVFLTKWWRLFTIVSTYLSFLLIGMVDKLCLFLFYVLSAWAILFKTLLIKAYGNLWFLAKPNGIPISLFFFFRWHHFGCWGFPPASCWSQKDLRQFLSSF